MILLLFSIVSTVTVNLIGVAAAPAIGTGSIKTTFTASGVAADPQIGVGTVITGGDVTVDLVGVAADPQIGTGTVQISGVVRSHATEGFRPRPKRKPKPEPDPTFVFHEGVVSRARVGIIKPLSSLKGVSAKSATGIGNIAVIYEMPGWQNHIVVGGQVRIARTDDLTPDEILALLEA